jgi:hypothetical protein
MMKVSHDVVVRIKAWCFLLSLDVRSRPPPKEAATEGEGRSSSSGNCDSR